MQLLCVLVVLFGVSSARYLMVSEENVAEETQHAVCKIVTEELQATANVTLTRELRGVCTSIEINLKLEELRNVLLNELKSIREELRGRDNSLEPAGGLQKLSNLQKRTAHNDSESGTRDAEIAKYNATINSSIKGTFFHYYWKIENVNEILSDTRGISVRSPSFSLLRHTFHILLFPHHLTSKYLGMQMKTPLGYFLKHRFTIIDHFSAKGDLSSQLLGDERNYAVMYRVAHDRVETQNFIDHDVLIIKLTIKLK